MRPIASAAPSARVEWWRHERRLILLAGVVVMRAGQSSGHATAPARPKCGFHRENEFSERFENAGATVSEPAERRGSLDSGFLKHWHATRTTTVSWITQLRDVDPHRHFE